MSAETDQRDSALWNAALASGLVDADGTINKDFHAADEDTNARAVKDIAAMALELETCQSELRETKAKLIEAQSDIYFGNP